MSMIKQVPMDQLAGTTLGTYHLERFIGQSKIGPTFLARTDTTTTYLLRFLDGPMYTTPKEYEVYLEHFQYRANQIATLQHPYILPLFDFGIFRGFPYLVTPHIPLRSLRTRIDKNGVLNTYHGVDVNGDGQIDPVAGEAGAITAYQQGQLMATLSLVPSA